MSVTERPIPSGAGGEVFTLVLVKPTHYDDDGYPIQWFRSALPSNTLACMNGLAEDARERRVLGDAVDICIETYDETNRRVYPARIIRDLKRRGGKALIGIVGVQSNQYPRALDMARRFREAGLTVAIGGFHVSGCIAMLPEMPPELKEAQSLGISLFAGEAEEGRLDEVLRDAYHDRLEPLYNFMNQLPALNGEPAPILPRKHVERTSGTYSSIDLGRGCPYQCSFCTIINVQGRKSRFRTPDDLENIIRVNVAQGIKRFFITDDNFARNSDWEILMDRVIKLREEEGIKVGFTIQVDTLCHKIPNFIEKTTRAGARTVFIGLENVNPDNLIAAKKRQNKITEYRAMLQKWRAHGAVTYAGYILGFPADTKETIVRDIEIIKRELPVDLLEFFILTPLPGSEDHKNMVARGEWMDGDINKYDLNHRVTHHSKMSDTEWEEAYKLAWDTFYSPDHMRTVMKRAAQIPNGRPKKVFKTMLWFKLMIDHEGVHPLEGGALRLKSRRDRRHGMRLESPFVFYPKYWGSTAVKLWKYWRFYAGAKKTYDEVMADPERYNYNDIAIAPPGEDEFEQLSLYHATSGGEAALARKKRGDVIREATSAVAH
ncbi:B12-binding domain-containing radical SAM protein [Martelella alba]|uniref:B12-binding domain-containing radical SAM protein n=1 Tax=Martelella alba TaxID=2590451 RepID=UPI001F38E825|nr:radical SAM protein [Martelella alba]